VSPLLDIRTITGACGHREGPDPDDPIVATPTVEGVTARSAEDEVILGFPMDGVIPIQPADDIFPVGVDQMVVPHGAHERAGCRNGLPERRSFR
jgi:hypothetical protein